MNDIVISKMQSPALSQAKLKQEPVADGGVDFGQTMQRHIEDLRELFNASEEGQRQFAIGELDAQSAVMLVNKADLAMTYTMELRTKVLEAYQEITRLQI
jgi:flagellar hook-basal body complex protein FliE